MNKFLKISIVAVLLIIVGFFVFLYTLDINKYKPALVAEVSEQTGRSFSIDGDLEIVPSLTPSIRVTGIHLGNADWAVEDEMLSVGQVVARVSVLPLLSGAIHINQFILVDTVINLEKRADGTGNWELEIGGDGSANVAQEDTGESTLPPINIEEIEIRDASISFNDAQADSITRFSITEFVTSVTDIDDPFEFSLEAYFNDLPLNFSGTLGPLSDLLAGGSYSVDVSGWFSDLQVSAVGSIESVREMRGGSFELEVTTNSLSNLDDLSGSELPDTGPFSLTGTLKLASASRLSVSDLAITLGDTAITGNLEMDSGNDVPSITVNLASELIDLTPFQSEAEEQEAEYLFPREDLPLDLLASVNADISLTAGLLKLPAYDLSNNRLNIRLQNGSLSLTNNAGIAGGTVSTSIGLQPGADNLATLNTEISGSDIMLELIKHESDQWFTGGPTEIAISGSGHGGSVAEIMGAFNGNMLVTVGEATMPNSSVDMFGADILLSTFNRLNPLSQEEDSTLLECAVINLDIVDGIIKLDRQIAIQTNKMYMVGSGEIDLKTEQLNLGVRPYAKEGVGLNFSSVAGAARIGGTLANPRAEVDAANAIKTGLSAGAAVATGGVSLLAQGLFSRQGADPEPCNTALGIEPSETTTTDDQADAAPAEESGNVIDNVKDTFKGLFGR